LVLHGVELLDLGWHGSGLRKLELRGLGSWNLEEQEQELLGLGRHGLGLRKLEFRVLGLWNLEEQGQELPELAWCQVELSQWW
jgi:hypothetical protein